MNRTIVYLGMLIVSVFIVSFFHRAHKSRSGDPSPSSEPSHLFTSPKKSPDKPDSSRSKIQVVFALDATGSMSGLIDAAKEKIWSIAGSLAQADPAPVIEIGLLFYRDRGDAYITRKVALSRDLDEVYEKLMQISAEGGGDSPESVNQALHESVTAFAWDSSGQTYKTIFLVGDCPPHMDYPNDIKYPVSCSDAKQKDIILNTILMGNNHLAKRIWNEIASCSQGSYTEVAMDANDIIVNTPYDSAIAGISDQLDDTRLYYGNEEEKTLASEKVSKSKLITSTSRANVKAQRAEYNSTKTGKEGYYGKKELLESYRNKSVELETINQDELPDAMKNLNADQKKKFVEERMARRDSLQKSLSKLTQQREAFIEHDLATRKAGEVDSSFTNQIYKSIKKQTETKNIHLKAKPKY
jgi:Mg-chelatase subunit ChlD